MKYLLFYIFFLPIFVFGQNSNVELINVEDSTKVIEIKDFLYFAILNDTLNKVNSSPFYTEYEIYDYKCVQKNNKLILNFHFFSVSIYNFNNNQIIKNKLGKLKSYLDYKEEYVSDNIGFPEHEILLENILYIRVKKRRFYLNVPNELGLIVGDKNKWKVRIK